MITYLQVENLSNIGVNWLFLMELAFRFLKDKKSL